MTTTTSTLIRLGATTTWTVRARVTAVPAAYHHANTTAWFGTYAGITKHHRRPQEVPPH
jgi:hypothetical protein